MAQPAAKVKRPIAYLIHSVVGLKLSVLLLFVCATGTIAVVSNDLEWLFRPEVRATTGREAVSWGRQYAAARAAYPQHVINYATAGEESYLATSFSASGPRGDARVIWVDPGTGRVTGESSWISFVSVMRALHYHLFTDRTGSWLFYIVCFLGVILIVSAITGLLVYKKFWRGWLRTPRLDRGDRVFTGDLHKLAGLWSVVFVLIIGLTSVWYFVERVVEEVGAVELERFPSPMDEAVVDATGPVRLPLDQLIGIATREIPELRVREIWFPASPEEPLLVRGQASEWLVRDRTNTVELNSFNGDVLRVDRARTMRPLERWVHTADPLHFGDFGGVWSKLLWVAFGIVLCLLSWTGVSIHVQRTARAVQAIRENP